MAKNRSHHNRHKGKKSKARANSTTANSTGNQNTSQVKNTTVKKNTQSAKNRNIPVSAVNYTRERKPFIETRTAKAIIVVALAAVGVTTVVLGIV